VTIADCEALDCRATGSHMDAQDFTDRTRAFALRVVRLVEALPRNRTNEVLDRNC
jgi:hypothetical protein